MITKPATTFDAVLRTYQTPAASGVGRAVERLAGLIRGAGEPWLDILFQAAAVERAELSSFAVTALGRCVASVRLPLNAMPELAAARGVRLVLQAATRDPRVDRAAIAAVASRLLKAEGA